MSAFILCRRCPWRWTGDTIADGMAAEAAHQCRVVTGITHGNHGYCHHGCRCDVCTEAHGVFSRRSNAFGRARQRRLRRSGVGG